MNLNVSSASRVCRYSQRNASLMLSLSVWGCCLSDRFTIHLSLQNEWNESKQTHTAILFNWRNEIQWCEDIISDVSSCADVCVCVCAGVLTELWRSGGSSTVTWTISRSGWATLNRSWRTGPARTGNWTWVALGDNNRSEVKGHTSVLWWHSG